MARFDIHHHHPPGPQPLGKVAIIGLGLIGGSLGQVLCAVGAAEQVTGWDSDASTRESALEYNAVHRIANDAVDAVSDANLVVLCVPVNQVVEVIRQISPSLPEFAVVTDVASAKGRIVAEGEAILGIRFVGGHPMAGSEESGFSASSVDLFDAAMWIVTPTQNTDEAAVEVVCRMADWCGAAARICSPEEHDRVAAYLSHLPHIAAFGLASAALSAVPADKRDLGAGSFKSGTRVALSTPEQWAEILLDNRHAAMESLSRFRSWLELAGKALEDGNRQELFALLSDGHSARKQFPR